MPACHIPLLTENGLEATTDNH